MATAAKGAPSDAKAPSLEARVTTLEEQVSNLQHVVSSSIRHKDWRRTIGMFTDDEVAKSLFLEAQKLREADRKRSLTKRAKGRRT